jgi:hypothetical protein
MRAAVIAVVVAACCSAPPPEQPAPPGQPPEQPAPPAPRERPANEATPAMKPALPAALETELDAIRREPGEAIGLGDKAYTPYEPNVGEALIGSDDPAVTERLLAEARGGGDRVYRLAALHLLGKRADDTVDAALVAALEDADLRAMAAYLLGRMGFKGYRGRARDEAKVLAALRGHLDDPSSFEDPFYRKTFRTQDFVLGAFVRVKGPQSFTISDPMLVDLIGYALPSFTDAVRADLLRQAKPID